MKPSILTTITALLLIIAPISMAQETLGLPEGAIARFGKGELRYVKYSPDGTQLAVGSSIGIWIYDTTTYQPVHLLTKNDLGTPHFVYHPTKNTLVSYDRDGRLNLWNTDDGKLISELTSSNPVKSIAFNANGDTIATGGYNRIVYLFDANTGQQKQFLKREPVNGSSISSIAFNPNGFMVAAADESGKIIFWDTITGEHIQDLKVGRSEVRSIAFNNDGSILASGSALGSTVRLWDMETMQETQTLKPEADISGINHITFSADSGTLAAACVNGTIQLWDVNTYEHIGSFTHIGLNSVSFSPDMRTLASSSGYDGAVRIWNIFSGEMTHTISDFTGDFNCFAVSPDTKTIACQGKNRTVYLFDATTGTLQKTIRRPSYRDATDIVYSPDGKTFAAADYDAVTLFDVNTGKEINRLDRHLNKSQVDCVAFSPDGNTIASGSRDMTVSLWNADTGELKHTLEGHQASVISVAFSPDGSTLASGGHDMLVYLWDVNTGEKKLDIRKHGMKISDLAFSPDSKTLASAGYSPNIYLWDVATGKRHLFLRKNPSQVSCVAFSPDGKLLAIGSTTKGIFIYDVSTKKIVHNFIVNNRWVKRLAFASDGWTLVSQVSSAIYLWDMSVLQP